MRAFEKGLSGVRLHPAIEALPVATGSAAALGGGYLGGRSARKSKSASALKKEAILAGTIAGGVTGSRKGRPWEGAGWGALGGLGGAIASNLTTKALFGRPLILPGMAASGLAGHYLAKHMMKDKKKKASVKLARDMPHFTEQDRPEKVKDIYRALKRDHPDMPAAMKARIAARQGKKGKQHQGPPYKGPLTKKAGIQKESIVGTTIGAIGAGEGNRVRGGLYGLGLGNALAVPGFLTRNPALMAAGAVGGGALGAYLARKHGKATKKTKKAAVSFNSGVPTEFEKEALMPLLRSAGRVLKGAGKAAVGGNFARAGKIMKAAPKAMAGQWKGMSTGQKLLATGVGAGGAGLAAGHMLTPQNKVVVASVEPDLMDVGEKAGRLLAKSAALNNTPISPEELEESIQEAQGREDIPGRARRWGIAGGLGGGAVGALPGIAGTLAMKRIRGKLGLPGALAGAGLTGLGALAGGALGQRLGSGYGAEEAAADKAVSLLRALRAHQAGAQLGYGAGLRQGSAVGGFEPGEGRRP